jgi:hypothetical protein
MKEEKNIRLIMIEQLKKKRKFSDISNIENTSTPPSSKRRPVIFQDFPSDVYINESSDDSLSNANFDEIDIAIKQETGS